MAETMRLFEIMKTASIAETRPAELERIFADLEAIFPDLSGTGYSITSPAVPGYNCFAWAGEDTRNWWQPIALRGARYYKMAQFAG